MLPHFIIIGAMKCGTTSLYQYLASHPDAAACSLKEPDFFASPDSFDQGLSWYTSLFPASGRYAFEVSPNYTKRHLFPGVPERMYSVLPEVRLIYMLRDPVERIVSHYVHNYADGLESRSLSEVLQEADNKYVLTSKYFYQLQAFLEYYREDQILLIESEQLRKDPGSVLDTICRFVGLTADFDSCVISAQFHESSSKKRRSPWQKKLAATVQNRHIRKHLGAIARLLRPRIDRPQLSVDERQMLMEVLGPNIDNLRRFSGERFSTWSL